MWNQLVYSSRHHQALWYTYTVQWWIIKLSGLLLTMKNQNYNLMLPYTFKSHLSAWADTPLHCFQPRPLLLAPTAVTWQTSTSAPSFCSSSSQITCLGERRSLGPFTSTSWKINVQDYWYLLKLKSEISHSHFHRLQTFKCLFCSTPRFIY